MELLNIVEKNKNSKSEELVSVKKDIEHSKNDIARIEGEIEKMEEQLLRRDELQQYRLWISEYFIPAIREIEINVLTSINTEFNLLFQKWISYLLEAGDIIVRVDDSFTSIIEQDGYEMDVESLSGGEKTSVALAYRLALNVMVARAQDKFFPYIQKINTSS
jgi:exonuclease SbcC